MLHSRADRRVIVGLVVLTLLAGAQVAAFWPGIMTWDAIRQYGQAVSGRYDDWHPPAMNWLWRVLRGVAKGPAPMLVVQAALYWTGTGLWMLAAWRRGRPKAACVIAVLACAPIALVLGATVLKDSVFAGTLLVASGLLAVPAPVRGMRIVAGVLLVAAATLRFNAVPACLPLLIPALPVSWRATLPRLCATGVLAAIPLVLALPLANAVLGAERSGVELSLVIYDLGGTGRFAGVDVFPPTGVPAPVAVNRDCYSPVSWDRYAWWGAAPCAIGFATLRAPLVDGHGPYGWWADAVLHHPLAYAEHRLAHFDRNTRFLVHDADLPGLSLASDPNPWGFAVTPNRTQSAVAVAAAGMLCTPLGWPVCWIALGIGLLVVRPSLRSGDPAVALAWSAVLYAFSYLPLSVASEVRYHFWTMTAVGVAAVWMLDWAMLRGMPRWRLAAAGVPLGVAMLGGVIARIL